MDARRARSRAQLSEAILQLASKRDAGALSVSEVAYRAGVHRSTFYEHASSPIDLLHSVLREELDALRESLRGDQAPAAAVSAVTRGVLGHIERHAAVYARGLGESGLHGLLSAHFMASLSPLARGSVVALPFSFPGIDEQVMQDAVTHYIAEGAVGAMEVWLTTPPPRDPDWFLALYDRLVPEWWSFARS